MQLGCGLIDGPTDADLSLGRDGEVVSQHLARSRVLSNIATLPELGELRNPLLLPSEVWSTSAASAKLKITILARSPVSFGRHRAEPVIMVAWRRAPCAVQQKPWPLGAGFMLQRGGWWPTAAPLHRPALHGLYA